MIPSITPSAVGTTKEFEAEASLGLIGKARSPYWLAPMAGITELVFRWLMDDMGAGVLVSELVSAKGVLHNSGKTRKMMRVHPNPGTLVGIQLFGESAEDIIAASSLIDDENVSFIDINLGCPVKKVVKKGCGAALMRDPGYLEKYLSSIKQNIDLPLTVKMRTGWSDQELTIHECVQAAYNAGCEWVAIHGRTRAQGYTGKADWDLIREVKLRAKIPIIGNGDIRSAKQAKSRLQDTGVDAVMIGRAALRDPWIFRACLNEERKKEDSPWHLVNRYLGHLENYYDTRHKLIMLRKFSTWLAYGYPGAAAFRKAMFESNSLSDVMRVAEDFFHQTSSLPPPRFEDSEAFMMGGHG